VVHEQQEPLMLGVAAVSLQQGRRKGVLARKITKIYNILLFFVGKYVFLQLLKKLIPNETTENL
jgi:hypothetical protein